MSEYSEDHNGDNHSLKDSDYHTLPRVNEIAQKFLSDLDEERKRLSEEFPLCHLLIEEAIDRVFSTGRIPGREYYADVYKQKPIKITQKVFVPVKQYPKFNFTGKILGPKGNSLRRLQEETQCKITIKGRSSIRDRAKEEELRNCGDPRYAHLHKDLFLEISAVSTPAESYARVAYALAEIRKYLVPDKNDDVSHEQLRELMEIDPDSVKLLNGVPPTQKSVFDKKIAAGASASKFLSFIKHESHNSTLTESSDRGEHEKEAYTYEPRGLKRPMPGYEYIKARPTASAASPYKRTQTAAYVPDVKRLREAPPRIYKPNPYAILKKYK